MSARDALGSLSKPRETGIEEMRRAVRTANDTHEAAFIGFTAEECLGLIRACWASAWDVYPHDLTPAERRDAATTGKLSKECNARLDKVLG